MRNLNKKKLVQDTLKCLWTEDPAAKKFTIQSSALFFMRDGWIIYFGTEEAKAFQRCLDQVLRYDSLVEKYSTKAIRGSFESLLVKLITKYEDRPADKDVKQGLDSWLEEMLTAVDYDFEYFSIIENLKSETEKSFGRVRIEPISEMTIGRIKDVIFDRVDKNPSHTEEEKEIIKNKIYEDSLSKLEEVKFASFASTSLPVRDVDKGFEIANERFREVVDLLRFLGALTFRQAQKRPIGLHGEISVGEIISVALSDTQGWKVSHSFPTYPFELNSERIKLFEKFGLSHISLILGKALDNRTEFENRLVNAIHWVSEALQETSDPARFLKFCISLESLLCGPNEEALGTTIGERLAFLLEEEADKRQIVFRKLKRIYRIRSKIAHEGRPEKENDVIEEIPYAFAFSIHSIVKIIDLMCNYRWEKFQELRKHFEQLKFN